MADREERRLPGWSRYLRWPAVAAASTRKRRNDNTTPQSGHIDRVFPDTSGTHVSAKQVRSDNLLAVAQAVPEPDNNWLLLSGRPPAGTSPTPAHRRREPPPAHRGTAAPFQTGITALRLVTETNQVLHHKPLRTTNQDI